MATTCNSGTKWQYSGYYSSNYSNAGASGDIDFSNMTVANTSDQHAIIYLSSGSESDPLAVTGSDWLQAGYGIGTVDAATATSTEVYEEASDQNTQGGAVAHFYSYSLGNYWFETYYTGETNSQGYGLYQAWYVNSQNAYNLGSVWSINPEANSFSATFEGDTWAGTENCPSIGWGLLGSTGNINNVTSTSATQLDILTSAGSWVQWAAGRIATTKVVTGNYSLTTYNQYYLFKPAAD
jgi:hypothetical protein